MTPHTRALSRVQAIPGPTGFIPWLTLAVLFGAAFLFATTSPASPPSPSREAKPIRVGSFRLNDQFGTNHQVDFPRTRPVLLLVGDRRGSEEIDAWVEPLKKHWKGAADIYGIADVQAVPRFLRQRVTEGIRKSRPKPLLLDFEGRVTETLPCLSKTANIFVLTTNGTLAAHISGPYLAGTNAEAKLRVLGQAIGPGSP